jgi:hypothetical protein
LVLAVLAVRLIVQAPALWVQTLCLVILQRLAVVEAAQGMEVMLVLAVLAEAVVLVALFQLGVLGLLVKEIMVLQIQALAPDTVVAVEAAQVLWD